LGRPGRPDVAAITEGSEIYVGHTEIDGRKRTGIHTQALGIDLVVDVNDLGKAGITKPALQNLVVADAPGPAQAGHRAREGATELNRSGLWVATRRPTSKRRGALQTISKNVAARDGITLIDAVINFNDELVHIGGGGRLSDQSVGRREEGKKFKRA